MESNSWGALKIINNKQKIESKLKDTKLMGLVPFKERNYDKIPFLLGLNRNEVIVLDVKRNKKYKLFERHDH